MKNDNRNHRDPIEGGDLVFVYGTLRNGQPNNWILSASLRIVGTFETVDRYRRRDLGAFPAAEHITSEPGAPGRGIVGEVYRVRAHIGRELDRLEINGRMYRRALRTVCRGGGARPIQTADELEFSECSGWVRAWVYEIIRPRTHNPVIESGDWFDRCDRRELEW